MEKEKYSILIVEDNKLNRETLVSVFEDQYDIVEAENGLDGLEKLMDDSKRISAVLLDLMMPVMDGIGFLQEFRKTGLQTEIPVFVVSADQSTPRVMEAYNLGVMDVIAKPVVPFIISRRINSVIELFHARKLLSSEVQSQRNRLLEQQQQIIELNAGLTEALFAAIECRSGETGAHVRRIKNITQILLSETDLGNGYSENEILCIATASMLHDIGKISIPDAILNKPGRFTPEERAIMETHTTLGVELMEKIPQLKTHDISRYACEIIRQHHERWDGKGYPDGLKGDEISLPAQVVGIADVYEALLSKRVYKDAYSRDKAINMIVTGECGIFSPKLLKAFNECEPKLYKAILNTEQAEKKTPAD